MLDMSVPVRLTEARLVPDSFASLKLTSLRFALSKIAFPRSKPSKFLPVKSAPTAYIVN